MNRETAIRLLKKNDACSEAIKWFEKSRLTPKQAWRQCPRGDWLSWIAGRMKVERKQLIKAACACTRLSLKFIPKGEERPLKAIETAEAWANNEDGFTLQQVAAAASAASASADAARNQMHKRAAEAVRRYIKFEDVFPFTPDEVSR